MLSPTTPALGDPINSTLVADSRNSAACSAASAVRSSISTTTLPLYFGKLEAGITVDEK